MKTASTAIIDEVGSWQGVDVVPGDRGSSVSFKFGRRELGHLHGDYALHAGFPKAVWSELFEQGRIDYHPVFPGKAGFAARRIEGEEDVLDAIALLRVNYDRVLERYGLPEEGAA